jgi:hypothetical protein
LSYKIFSFCEQILKIGANGASGETLHEEITGIRSQVPAIFTENNEGILGDFNYFIFLI